MGFQKLALLAQGSAPSGRSAHSTECRGGFGGRGERKNAAEGGRRARDFKRGCSKMAENSHFWTKKKIVIDKRERSMV